MRGKTLKGRWGGEGGIINGMNRWMVLVNFTGYHVRHDME